jgi:glycosyltransferase involved in cell wall biosynthesis
VESASKIPLSVVILTCNEEQNLPDCLKSLKGLDCEVFVVDSGSADQTVQLAKSSGAHVANHHFENYAAQRNWAQQNLPIRSDWVLHLDADERLTPELVAEISEALRAAESTAHGAKDKPWQADNALDAIDGFLLRKRTFFMGRWIRHGGHYPSYHLRLFRQGKGFCEERLYDQHFLVDGKIGKLKNDYLDVLTSDLNTWTQRHLRWAELEARELLFADNGNGQVRSSFFGNPIERRRWLKTGLYARSPLFIRPLAYWVYRYFLRLGFLDGKEGFIFHFLQGFWFRLLVDIKLDELRRQQRSEVRNNQSTEHGAASSEEGKHRRLEARGQKSAASGK